MKFGEIFRQFLEHKDHLKVIFVASSDQSGQPSCAPKMLVDIVKPNKVYYLEFKFSKTYANVSQNWQVSLSFMDDRSFTGFRLSGFCEVIDSGREFELVKRKWIRKVAAYEAERMIGRIKGIASTRESEIMIPDDFVIIKFTAEDGALVKPDRVLRSIRRSKGYLPNGMAEKTLEAGGEAIEKRSLEDELTGLYNRRGFMALMEHHLRLAKRSGRESCLIVSGLDQAKAADNTREWGEDEAAVEMAKILKRTFRESDILARLGGGRFAVAVLDCPAKDLDSVKARLQKNIDHYNQDPNTSIPLGIRLGAASCLGEEPAKLEDLLSRTGALVPPLDLD